MSEPSVRETAARALEGHQTYGSLYSGNPAELRALTDAVLAAVAAHDGLADVLRAMLVDYGLSGDGELHSWRCSHPDRYGPCTCLDELTKDLADVVRAWVVGDDEATPVKHGPTIAVTEQGLDTLAHTWNSALGMAEGFDDQEETGA